MLKPEAVEKLFDKLGPRFNQRPAATPASSSSVPAKATVPETAKLELVGSELVKRAAERAARREEKLKQLRENQGEGNEPGGDETK